MNTRSQLEEIHFLVCSLLPSEHFAFVLPQHDLNQWSSLLDNYTEHGSAPTDDPASACRFQVSVKPSPVWFEVELPTDYPRGDEPAIYVKGNNLGRVEQEKWQTVIHEKLDELRMEGADFIVQSLLCLHLLPLLHEQATLSQPLDHSSAAPPSPSTSTETHHVLFTSHHLISPTKRRNLQKWSSELSLHAFAKVGYPGVIYAEGAQADVTEFVSRVKAMQWLALKVRFEERLDTQTFAKLTSGENIDKKDHGPGDTHWIELNKVGEVIEFMRRCGREKFITDMGIGSA